MSRRDGYPGEPLRPPPRRAVARDNIDVREMLADEMASEMRAERAAQARAAQAGRVARPPAFRQDPRDAAFRTGRERVDVHELLVEEMRGERAETRALREERAELSLPDPTDVYGVSDQYMVLDSWHKVQSSRVDQGEFVFNFMVQGATGDQVIGVHDRIDNVIQIQIGSFAFPQLMDVPYVTGPDALGPGYTLTQNNTNAAPRMIVPVSDPITGGFPPLLVGNVANTAFPLTSYGQYPPYVIPSPVDIGANPGATVPWVANPYSQTPFGNRITIQVKEAGLQSYSDAQGARHHFEHSLATTFFAGGNPNMLTAVPACGGAWDTFTFTDPLKDLHGCTLQFRGVDRPLAFLQDVCQTFIRILPEAMLVSAPIGPLYQVMVVLPDAGLCVGDRVYIRGFAPKLSSSDPSSPSANSIVEAYINRPEGHTLAMFYENEEPVPDDPNDPPATTTVSAWLPPGTQLNSLGFAINPVAFLDPGIQLPVAGLGPPVPGQSVSGDFPCTMFIAKRRLRIPIRVRRVIDRRTNYISP